MTTEQGAPVYLETDAPVEVLAAKDGKPRRAVLGTLLPYGEELRRDHWSGARRQMFEAGAGKLRANAALYFGHDHLDRGLPIGRMANGEQTETGLRAEGRFSETTKAAEVYALATPDEDGVAVLNRFSAGYLEVAGRLEDDGDLYVHTEVDVFEGSLVPVPAYESAVVDTVLSSTPTGTPTSSAPTAGAITKETPMTETPAPAATDTLEADVAGLREEVTTLSRQLATMPAVQVLERPAPPVEVPGSTMAEFLQMAVGVHGEAAKDKAMAFLAFAGGTTTDLGSVLKDSWVGDRFRRIEEQRTVLNLFTRRPLPAEGMGIEFGVVGTDTTKVEKQAAEGDTLAYGKITFDTDRAGLETFGGWGDMSRQMIERAPRNVIETFFAALGNKYALTTEARVEREVVDGGVTLAGTVTDMSTAAGWTQFVIRAARAMKKLGYPLEGILVGFDVFEELALMPSGLGADRPFLDRENGTVAVKGLSGTVHNVPVTPFEAKDAAGVDVADVIRGYNSEAISTYEDGRAPVRLQDGDITKLTEAFSLYGYMVTAPEVPAALVKPKTA